MARNTVAFIALLAAAILGAAAAAQVRSNEVFTTVAGMDLSAVALAKKNMEAACLNTTNTNQVGRSRACVCTRAC